MKGYFIILTVFLLSIIYHITTVNKLENTIKQQATTISDLRKINQDFNTTVQKNNQLIELERNATLAITVSKDKAIAELQRLLEEKPKQIIKYERSECEILEVNTTSVHHILSFDRM